MSQHTSRKGTSTDRRTSIGGQALMEGIMMRGPHATAMAVRNTSGEIVLEEVPVSAKKRPSVLRWPLIRGMFAFFDSMSLGYRCLMRSAEISGLEELEAEAEREKAAKKAAREEKKRNKTTVSSAEARKAEPEKTGSVGTEEAVGTTEEPAKSVPDAPVQKPEKSGSSFMTGLLMVLSLLLGIGLAVLLFFWLPSFLYNLAADHISWVDGNNRYMRSAFEGILKILLIVGYMSAMALMKDIRRTFRYHGAEHKTIFCYEHGLELTVENVRIQRRFHPRCGTSFLILMLLVGILIGFFIPATLPVWARVLFKLLLLPLTMGVGYELIKLCGRYDNWLTKIIAAPGLALQHLTVFEPDDGMIECAIAAMKKVIPEDGSDLF